MKTKIGTLVLVLCTCFFTLNAQRHVTTTARATSYDISDYLDLEAAASIFGDSENLEDFERRLNDPKIRISNLETNFVATVVPAVPEHSEGRWAVRGCARQHLEWLVGPQSIAVRIFLWGDAHRTRAAGPWLQRRFAEAPLHR